MVMLQETYMFKHQEFFLYLSSDNPSYKYDGTSDEGQPNKSLPAGVSARNCRYYIDLGASSLRCKDIKGCNGDNILWLCYRRFTCSSTKSFFYIFPSIIQAPNIMAPAMKVGLTIPCLPARPPGTAVVTLALGP
jgi:hypothetical protein